MNFWVLGGLGLGLRLILLLFQFDAPLVGDALYYDGVASGIEGGYEFEPYWPPGLTHYLAFWKVLFGLTPGVSRLAMLPWFLGLLWTLRRTLVDLAGPVAANIGVCFLCFYPAFVHHSIEPLSHLPAATLLLFAFSNYLRQLRRPRNYRWWMMGFALGLTVLFRPSVFLLLLAWPLYLCFSRPRAWQMWVPGLLLCGLVLMGLQQGHDRFVWFNDANARNFYLGNTTWTDAYKTWYYGSHWAFSPSNPAPLRAELESIRRLEYGEQGAVYLDRALHYIRQEPGRFLWRTGSRVRTLLAADSFSGSRLIQQGKRGLGYLVLGLDGCFFLLVVALALRWWLLYRGHLETGQKAALVLIGGYALPYCFSFSHPTYHVALMPLIILFAALAGQAWLKGKELDFRTPRWWYLALGLLFLIQLEWLVQMSHPGLVAWPF